MKLTEAQAAKLIEKASIKRPCINCGFAGGEETKVKFIKMQSVIPVVEPAKSESEDVPLTFMVVSCSNCGYTTFIDLGTLGVL